MNTSMCIWCQLKPWVRAATFLCAVPKWERSVLQVCGDPLPGAKSAPGMGHRLIGVVHTMSDGKSWPAATSGSRPLFGEDVVNLLHDPFCPLNCSGDHGGGSRTLPGVEEIVGGSQVTSREDSRHNRQHSVPHTARDRDRKPGHVRVNGIPPLRTEREGVGHPRET